MRSLFFVATLTLLAGPTAAQKICEQFNSGLLPSFSVASIGPRWVLGRFTATIAHANVSGMELMAYSNVNGIPVNMGIWSVDSATGQPGVLLAWGTATLNRERRPYSAALSPAISLAAGTDFYIGCRIGPGGAIVPFSVTGVLGDIYTGTMAGWYLYSGSALAMEFNLYCGTHSGTSQNYGVGKVGAGGYTPKVCLQGFPNIGNSIALQVVNTAASTFGGVVVGNAVPSGITLPLGTLYVFPIITSGASGTSAYAPGFVTFLFPIPNDPLLQGATLAMEGWVLDAAAANGVAHSDAIEITIGN